MADDGVVLGLGVFQEQHGRLAHRFVFVQFAVAKQQWRHGIDNQYVDGGVAQVFGRFAAAVVRQPYSPTGLIRPGTVGLSHCGSRKSVSFFMRLS